MNLTSLAIRYNRVTLIAIVALLISGISAYLSLPKAQDPGFTIRTATITTRLPGASPERIELLVTNLLEEKIQEMAEIDTITSESRTGISIISANFLESYTDMQPIFDDMRRKVESIAHDLPVGTEAPIVNDEFGDTFGHVYNLIGEGFSPRELRDISKDIRKILLKEKDIAKVEIYGDQKEVIYIEYENTRWLN